MVESLPPHIDLFNFEDPQLEEGKYVLTSPRSLEACSRLSLKPVELLYKGLVDYQEELLPQGVSLREIYQLFDEEEKERINKLYLCREERSKIIDEDSVLTESHHVVDSAALTLGGKKDPFSSESPLKESAVKAVLKMQDREEEALKRQRENVDAGSVARRRTAWTTSIGHKRVTSYELKKRAEEIHREGRRLIEKELNRKPVKPSTKKSSATK